MNEPDATQNVVILRLLDGSDPSPGTILGRQSNRIEIELENSSSYPPQTPVELSVPGMLLLGILVVSKERRVSIRIEHQVQVSRLERILNMWHQADAI